MGDSSLGRFAGANERDIDYPRKREKSEDLKSEPQNESIQTK